MLTALLGAVAAALAVVALRARRRATALAERLATASRELERLQQSFTRFAPAEVVEDIIARGVSTMPVTKEVTVLFADLRGFTALAETMPPSDLVRMLNGWFAAMADAVAAHRGHLAKFLGDGFLALFGALEANPWQTDDAVRAALAMRAAVRGYNARLRDQGLPPLAIAVGIHRGPVVAGLLGTDLLVEYGVIGATVNLASRVERLTREHGTDVLVTSAVRDVLDPRVRLRALPPAMVPGVAEPVSTFAVEAGVAAPAE
ncbi:MAG: adenylate/guanylate cyclase domain-containing protein [bacterium]|nr:adenylate/guanylate cyclase domain-containing protein [bacterium]